MAYEQADYITIGGGLTGCALVSRLHQGDPSLDILVLESGIDANLEWAFALAWSDLDYNCKSTPQPNTDNRVYALTPGKVLGGGSVLNYGGWARGDARDYDQWARTVKDERWSYKGFLPYLRKSEKHFKADEDPEQRGSDGPMRVTSVFDSDPKRRYGLRETIKAAWEELGLKRKPRGDCGFLAGICEFLENWNDGQRQPSNLAYSLRGFKVVNSATVHKVVFAEDDAGAPKASAAVLKNGRQFKARKEIVLSAGAIKTPQILMLSGIGPAEMLSKHDIPVVYNAPEVGKNYFDHFAHFQVWNLRNPDKALSLGTPDWNDPAFYKGLPCDRTVNEAVPLELREPAFQADASKGFMSDESLLDPARCFLETMVVYSSLSAPVPADGSYIATSVMLLVPTSRGSITITSASPSDASVIDPNYYHTEVDRSALVHGTRRVAKVLLETSAGKDYIECEGMPLGIPPLNAGSSDSDIDARIRASGMPHAHSAGTAAMGKVVDSSFRVKGVSGLRVADASVFPVAIGGHPQATLYGIAEQAAEMILQDE